MFPLSQNYFSLALIFFVTFENFAHAYEGPLLGLIRLNVKQLAPVAVEECKNVLIKICGVDELKRVCFHQLVNAITYMTHGETRFCTCGDVLWISSGMAVSSVTSGIEFCLVHYIMSSVID